ncbi:MAG: hypothetical protein HWE22_02470 [Flavobacteriales bacterium]|nr:hypothetical protein [Flavobacteriales bacterium]
MALDGFIQDNAKKFDQQRRQRKEKRKKFNGNFSEDAILKDKNFDKIAFPKLSDRQIEEERARIAIRHQKHRKNRLYLMLLLLLIAGITVSVLLMKTKGEIW